jgi:L-2-hydroxyglutarate oxidase LhgO
LDVEIIVIGAGVVGLAIGRKLAREKRTVIIVEQEVGFGRHSSSRNSEVVHAGFYYEPGSLKAETCVAGNRLLQNYASKHSVPLATIGKVVVAANVAEIDCLEQFLVRGRANGVANLRLITESELHDLEPEVRGCGALLSTATGIVDSHGFMQSLQNDFEQAGGMLAFNSPVEKGTSIESGMRLQIGGREPTTIDAPIVINAAGLFAPQLSVLLGLAEVNAMKGRLVKGNYFGYQGASPFKRLVYPLPSQDGLGIHATLDLAGQIRFGPDTEDVDGVDYGVNDSIRSRFAESIRKYWPGVEESRLQPDYSGIRSKIVVPDGTTPDFVIDDRRAQGVGVVNLFGIESPGLTSALALAEKVSAILN